MGTSNTSSPDQSSVLEQSNKFTPGPWEIGDTDLISTLVFAADTCLVADTMQGNGKDQDNANARLIAAGPELLAALEWLMKQKWVSVEKDNMEFQCRTTCYVLDAARAAIAKATGGA